MVSVWNWRVVPPVIALAPELKSSGSVKSWTPPIVDTMVTKTIVGRSIGGIQLFTEPLLFNSGANAITGGTTRQFQTLTMYVYEQAFPGQEFGYASSVAWVMFLLIGLIALLNVLLLRRLRGVH